MPYATKGEFKAREPWFTSEAQVACGYMGSESLVADFYPKTPPNSPRTVPLVPVLTEHMSKRVEIHPKNTVISASCYDSDALSFMGLV
ncbi:hypothetical protein AnigIFM60653_002835 [Aspergillus niger]|nr:hypothetical protein AnigIFM60653_002835 [Aspergillus niger]GLA44656.1 hypothetical protein AnigIFM63309_004702 [Aspergillus niger]